MVYASLMVACSAALGPTFVARPKPPDYAALAAGVCRYRPVQGREFRFTLGGGDDNPVHARTLAATPMADRGAVSCAIGEWEYSFHQLRNGQEDGAGQKHWGGYAAPPATRAQAMAAVHAYYDRLRAEAMAKATPEQRRCFISVNGHYCYQHYACEWGCDVVGSEVGENINSIQAHIAFTRGAARQYGKPWLMDFSSWYGPSMLDEDPRKTWGDNSGPTHGHSISLHVRTYLVSYMAGANIVVAEGGWLNCFRSQQPGPDGTLPLSSLGVEASRFYGFTRRHPERGIPWAPVALLLPLDHGIYPGFMPKLAWNAFPYTPADQHVLDALNALFPGSLGDPDQPERPDRQPGDPAWTDPDYMRTEALRLVASPHGDIADVLVSTASQEVLDSYPVVLLAGLYGEDAGLARRLERYVARGGTLVVGTADLPCPALPGTLAVRLPAPPPNGCAVAAYGRGRLIVYAPATPGQPTAERPLSQVLARVRRELVPFSVSGRIETLYSRAPDGWIVTLVNNEGVTKRFREAARIDPTRTQTVRLGYRGPGKVRRAVLWGADADQNLSPADVRVVVPPGEVRVVRLHVDEPGRRSSRRPQEPAGAAN